MKDAKFIHEELLIRESHDWRKGWTKIVAGSWEITVSALLIFAVMWVAS